MSRFPTHGLSGVAPADLGWLTGTWLGHNGADAVEEHWSPLGGDTLVGMFRWVRDGRVRFYELIAIERDAGHVVMRIRHFDPGLVGWDARWAVYRREGPDRLLSYFAQEGEPVTDPGMFDYARG